MEYNIDNLRNDLNGDMPVKRNKRIIVAATMFAAGAAIVGASLFFGGKHDATPDLTAATIKVQQSLHTQFQTSPQAAILLCGPVHGMTRQETIAYLVSLPGSDINTTPLAAQQVYADAFAAECRIW